MPILKIKPNISFFVACLFLIYLCFAIVVVTATKATVLYVLTYKIC